MKKDVSEYKPWEDNEGKPVHIKSYRYFQNLDKLTKYEKYRVLLNLASAIGVFLAPFVAVIFKYYWDKYFIN